MSTTCQLTRGVYAATFILLAGAGVSACGGGDDGSQRPPDARGTDPNAPDARPLCYSGGGTPTPGAEVELGAHRSGYIVLNENDELQLFQGSQGGHHFFAHARIRGLSAGDPEQPPETNPATFFHAFTEDGTDITVRPCAYPLAYEMNEDGDYVLPYPPILQIENRVVPEIYGQRVRITVEVTDGEGRYARDERWVIAVPADKPDAGVPAELPDAGVPDAGVPDAGVPADAPGAGVADAP
jgi:hypothetical protein